MIDYVNIVNHYYTNVQVLEGQPTYYHLSVSSNFIQVFKDQKGSFSYF